MTSDTDQLRYEPSDMAGLLEIKESTLRKYCLLLEKAGYKFHKGESGRRWYSDNDLIVLRRFMVLKNGDMSLENASQSVVAWAKTRDITPPVIKKERYIDRSVLEHIENQVEHIKKQNELIQELFKRLDQQEEYFKSRDKWLLDEMEKRVEKSVPELAAIVEEEKTIEDLQEKKNWWNRWFKK